MSQNRNQALVDSIGVGASVSAPTAGSTVASLGVVPAGTYRVMVVTQNAGTAETTATRFTNMNFRKGGTVVGQLLSTDKAATQVFERVTVDGTQSIQVSAGTGAIAGSIYVASISAVRVSG